jgi:hypothetical protein
MAPLMKRALAAVRGRSPKQCCCTDPQEYYALTAGAGDQFFGATGGAGYTYPWSLPTPTKYRLRVIILTIGALD